jgi:hypothetical protein
MSRPYMGPLAKSIRPLQGRSVSGLVFRGRCPRLLYGALAGHGGRVSSLASREPPCANSSLIRLSRPLSPAKDMGENQGLAGCAQRLEESIVGCFAQPAVPDGRTMESSRVGTSSFAPLGLLPPRGPSGPRAGALG